MWRLWKRERRARMGGKLVPLTKENWDNAPMGTLILMNGQLLYPDDGPDAKRS